MKEGEANEEIKYSGIAAITAVVTDRHSARPQTDKVGIMENRGSDPGANHGTMHYGGLSPNCNYSAITPAG